MKRRMLLFWLALLLVGCASIEIPPEKTVWAHSVSAQIAQASSTHYVYVPVADKQERKIVEYLADKQGKWTQRISQHGETVVCVFVYEPFFSQASEYTLAERISLP